AMVSEPAAAAAKADAGYLDVKVSPVAPGPALPEEAEKRKAEGNAAFQAKDFVEAGRLYGEAISIAEAAGADVPGVYYSNRSVCRASQEDWAGARSDGAEAIQRLTDPTAAAMKKAFFQKAKAEIRLELAEELEATLCLAAERGLRAEIERLLAAEGKSRAATPPPQQRAAKAK
ncbi:unnamed protein product, partial [Polarella glacialis]